jgi:hypothetical protein
MGRIEKSKGTTRSERYLAHLCQGTFLGLWSYPNVYRKQASHPGDTQGKELCDELVVFGNDVLIFSDKDHAFPNTGKLEVDWCRWYRKSVVGAAAQIYGAERWIRNWPHLLYLDSGCTTPFPLPLPTSSDMRVHRIVVARGAAERCRAHFNGGSGSLMLDTDIVGSMHHDPKSPEFQPFQIGHIDPTKGFVHVFDETTLDIVLREVDTVGDFTAYLRAKEQLFASGTAIMADGEEELLAWFLKNVEQGSRHSFAVPSDLSGMYVASGLWDGLVRSDAYRRKKQADRISYEWDELIDQFSSHAFAGTLVPEGAVTPAQNDSLLRGLASENRLHRRALATSFRDRIRRTSPGAAGFRCVNTGRPGTWYVFYCDNRGGPLTPDRQQRRLQELAAYCYVFAWRERSARRVIGIGTSPERDSYICLSFHPERWTPEMEQTARIMRQRGRIQYESTMTRHAVRSYEYPRRGAPDLEVSPMSSKANRNTPKPRQKSKRNSRCECGSGIKFKNCCGRPRRPRPR